MPAPRTLTEPPYEIAERIYYRSGDRDALVRWLRSPEGRTCEWLRPALWKIACEALFPGLATRPAKILFRAGCRSRDDVLLFDPQRLVALRGIGGWSLEYVASWLEGDSGLEWVKCPTCGGRGKIRPSESES